MKTHRPTPVLVKRELNDYVTNYKESPAYEARLEAIYLRAMDFTTEALEEMVDTLTHWLMHGNTAQIEEADRRINYLQRLIQIREERSITA